MLVSLTVTGGELKSRWLSRIQDLGRRQDSAQQSCRGPWFGNCVLHVSRLSRCWYLKGWDPAS